MGRKSGILAPSIAGSAERLAASVDIGGISFDGSTPIDLPGVNTAGNQDTTGNADTATTATTATTANRIPVIASSPQGTMGSAGELKFVSGSMGGTDDGLWMNLDATDVWKKIDFSL